jgi:phosphatidylethanolamine/phosphatidyl-N-methylethanolamine N-methyltransferase
MARTMNTAGVATAYARWAPVYDLVFGPVFAQGRAEAASVANRIGGRILEVGVGTGISLLSYAPTSRVTGIDISEPMLAKARARAARQQLGNIESIEMGDAERLDFDDNSFDVVVAQYVITACPNPEEALDELIRVARPGGEVVITTRVGAEDGMRGSIEKLLMPVTTRLGFRTDFPWARYEAWAAGRSDIALLERRPLPPLGHFALVRYTKLKAQ